MPTLSSQAAPEVVIMTTSGAAGEDKVGIMTTNWGMIQYKDAILAYQHRNSIVEVRWYYKSYLHNGISSKLTSLYWIRALVSVLV